MGFRYDQLLNENFQDYFGVVEILAFRIAMIAA
jgi:hypothetical protein